MGGELNLYELIKFKLYLDIYIVGCNKFFLDFDLCSGVDLLILVIFKELLEFFFIEEYVLREGGFLLCLIGLRIFFWFKFIFEVLFVFVEFFFNIVLLGVLLVDFVWDVLEFKYVYGVILDFLSVMYVEWDIEFDVIVVGVLLMLLVGIFISGDGSLGGWWCSLYFGVLMLVVVLLLVFI